MTWATVADARERWRECDAIPDDRLQQLLDDAWQVCSAYAPARYADATGTELPDRLVEANVSHARDLWAVMLSDTGDIIGFPDYAVRRRPLSDHVRQLLRPPTVPVVG